MAQSGHSAFDQNASPNVSMMAMAVFNPGSIAGTARLEALNYFLMPSLRSS